MILNIRDIDLKCHFTLPKIGLPKIKTLTPPMPVTPATKSGDIARRLVAGDKFIAATSLSDFFLSPLQVAERIVYRRRMSLNDKLLAGRCR